MTRVRGLLIGLLLVAITGCASIAGSWSETITDTDPTHSPDSAALAEARSAYANADSDASLLSAIEKLEALVAEHPGYPPLLVELAEAHTLYGAAYAQTRSLKRQRFLDAQALAERALLMQSGFRQALEAGDRPGRAAAFLEVGDVPSMVVWATATSYLFDEGMTAMGRIRNYRGLEDLRLFMEHAYALEPAYEYGLVPFSLAIFYIATPSLAGGDLDRARQLIEQAIATPGTSLMPRWGRARYLHSLTGDDQAKQADLEWVLAQDPRAVDSPYRWNIYVQRDARRMLAELR